MKPLLQRFGFKDSRYERPNQKWVCGWRADGKECPLGPDAGGKCHSTFECAPTRQGGRWNCTRNAAGGGRCEEGPKPDGTCCRPIPKCQPVRSLRTRRGLVSGLAVAFTIGTLAFLLGGPSRWSFVSPGPLTSHHGMSEWNCSDCHVGAARATDQQPAGLIADSPQDQDSHLCLKCHNIGHGPFQPHGMAQAELAPLMRKAETNAATVRPATLALSSLLVGGSTHQGGGIRCAVCHSEHRGKDYHLAQMQNSQCQSCHARQFVSFAKGHPTFSDFPYVRRTRIVFDHASHLSKHFEEAPFKDKAPTAATACTACHEPDPAGRNMLVKDFSVSCANCHAGQIEGQGRADAPGIAFFRVPGLDVEALEKRGPIGDWPTTADDEGKLTPFMQLLLSGDSTNRAALETLAKTDLFDLRKADTNVLAAVEQLVWAIKEFLFEFVTQGQSALPGRLQKTLPRELSSSQIALLAGQLPMDAILAAQREWFPNLLAEVPRHRRGEKPGPDLRLMLVSGTNALVREGRSLVIVALVGTNLHIRIFDDSGEKVIDKPEVDLVDGQERTELKALLSSSPFPDDSKLSSEKTGEIIRKATASARPRSRPLDKPVAADAWMVKGGWYRSKGDYAILYRPSDHADSFVQSWLDLAASGRSDAEKTALSPVFKILSSSEAPGICMKCHSIDETPDRNLQVNWRSARPVPDEHAFTRFSHAAHFSLLDQRGCLTCHQMGSEVKYLAAFKNNLNPAVFHSNFAPMEKSVCSSCHTPEGSGDNCLKCHNYHIGNFAPSVLSKSKSHK